MNNTCVSLPYHLRDILLWDIPSCGSLGVGVREMRRERIALFSGDGALEAVTLLLQEGHEPHAHKESTRQPWSRKPHRPRPICGFEMRARNEAGPRRMSPIALGRRTPSISVVGRVAPPFLDRTILSNSVCSLTRHRENLAYSTLPPLDQGKRSEKIRLRLQRSRPLLLPFCFRSCSRR